MTLHRINLENVELTDQSSQIYCVAEFWRESTLKGGYKHQHVPYNLYVAKDYKDAVDKLFDMAGREDDIIVDEEHEKGLALRDNSKYEIDDPSKAELIWEPGDRFADIGDYEIRIITVEELFEDYDPEPSDIERKNMGAGIDDFNLHVLQDQCAIVVHEEDDEEDE